MSTKWTPNEDATLVRVLQETRRYRDVHAALPHRSMHAVRRRARVLDAALVGAPPWTEQEHALLCDVAADLDYRRARRLFPNRTIRAIESRLSLFGLTKQRHTENGLSYTVAEVAAILDYPPSAIGSWVRRGILQASTVPLLTRKRTNRARMWRVPEGEVDRFIEDHPFLFNVATFPETKHKVTLRLARPERWITTATAARILGVLPSSVRQLTQRAGIQPRSVSGKNGFHYLRADIENYQLLQQRKRQLRVFQPQKRRRGA